MERRINTWDRKLQVLGYTYTLDQVNLDIYNTVRLPRWLLFRQPYWGKGDERRPGSELFLELTQPGGIGPMTQMKHLANEQAQRDAGSLYTLVELGWYDEDDKPYVHDIIVFDGEGGYVDSAARAKAERLAAKAAQ